MFVGGYLTRRSPTTAGWQYRHERVRRVQMGDNVPVLITGTNRTLDLFQYLFNLCTLTVVDVNPSLRAKIHVHIDYELPVYVLYRIV